MSGNKKDLTRIEDIGEYLHELEQDEEISPSFESSELPDIPSEETDFSSDSSDSSSFETDFSGGDFSSTEFESDVFSEPSESLESEVEEKMEEEPFSLEESHDELPALNQTQYKAPENFNDIKNFAENTSLLTSGAQANPSFSVLIKNIRFTEDVDDIFLIIKELKLLTDSDEQTKQRLMRGTLLVPRISEYAAIFLAHKLRRFDIDLLIGPSDEIHIPKHQQDPEVGLVSKHSLYQNQSHHFNFDHTNLSISQVIVASTTQLEGYQIIKYLGVASEHKMIEASIIEDEFSEEVPRHYDELAQRLKAHAMRAHANAVIGLNFQLMPLSSEFGQTISKYRLTCTGNLVWANKL